MREICKTCNKPLCLAAEYLTGECWACAATQLQAENERLRAENAGLRAALKDVAANEPVYETDAGWRYCAWCEGAAASEDDPRRSRFNSPRYKLGDIQHEPDCLYLRIREMVNKE